MRQILRWCSWQKIVLFVVLGIILYQSRLATGHSVIGWDSVMPELDWKLNFSRAIMGSWQEYQGLGLPGGMAHLADLPRILTLWILHFVVPAQYIRWIWHMGMLVLGPMGVWYLGKKIWRWSESACLAASIFYLLNLATVQYFFVPYESFSSFYGFLPWLLTAFLGYLEKASKWDLGKLIIVSILATSAFYVQTLFVVYVLVLGILSLGYLRAWKRILIGFLTIFTVNSFWLLPVLYSIFRSGGIVGLAKINSIASPETALMNTSFGGWGDVSTLQGYWLEYIEWVDGDQWGRLMQSWWAWSSQIWVAWLASGLFIVSIFGSVCGLFTKKMRLSWIIGLIFSYFMIASFNPPFGNIYQLLADNVPLFGEMFRSVFTKWSVVLALFVSVGLGNLVHLIPSQKIKGLVVGLLVTICTLLVWPVFGTGMISPNMKVEVPTAYSHLFAFMKTQPVDSRIAYLPTESMWSWKYTNWGYRGSGFLWYGIAQPILDRAFDVWSSYNETFYNQLSTALYSGNTQAVRHVLAQYDVTYILLDESVVAPGQEDSILRLSETKKLAEDLGWRKVFTDNFLSVYQIPGTQESVSAPATWTSASGDTTYARRNVISQNVGTYIEYLDSAQPAAIYPFAGMMRESVTNVTYGSTGTILHAEVQPGSTLVIPGWKVGEIVQIEYQNGKPVPAYTVDGVAGPIFLGHEKPEMGKSSIVARVNTGAEWQEYRREQAFLMDDNLVEITVSGASKQYDFGQAGQGSMGNCDVLQRGSAEKVISHEIGSATHYSAEGRGATCDYVTMPDLDTRLPYLLHMQGENIAGRSLKFFLYNTGSKRNDLEYLLSTKTFDETFTLLPWQWDGYYTLNIETRSFGQHTENLVRPVVVQYFPLEEIADARLSSSHLPDQMTSSLHVSEMVKTGTWLYRVRVQGEGLLRLSQGYDSGWIGVQWDGAGTFSRLTHVRVDGWANGWVLNAAWPTSFVWMLYWPQLLEDVGLIVLGISLAWVVTAILHARRY